MGALNGGCQIPIGAHAIIRSTAAGEPLLLELTGMVGSADGSKILKEIRTGTDPEALGLQVARCAAGDGCG